MISWMHGAGRADALAPVIVGSMLLLAGVVHAANGDCGQPSSDGEVPVTSDCLYILRTGVGTAECEPECICNTNGAGGVTASDAQLCLRRAVGQDVTLNCPCEVTTTTLGAADVVLNEIMADPTVSEDWIEIYNRGSATADLSGWMFTDNDPTHVFEFAPGTFLEPGAFLVVDRVVPGGFDFGLGTSGDQVNLYDDEQALVDSTEWVAPQANAPGTWGRSPNGTGPFTSLAQPSQGTANP